MMMAYNRDEIVTIGGGEITLYDNFEQLIGIIACYRNDEYAPLIVTNGSIKDRALLLNRLAISGIICLLIKSDASL